MIHDPDEFTALPESNRLDSSNAVYGTPGLDANYHSLQTTPFSCVPVTEGEIIESITGVHLSEAYLCTVAAEHDWLTSANGTEPENLGNLLELHGIETRHVDHADLGDIAHELTLGHKVILGLNSEKLIDTEQPDFTNCTSVASHAVWVTGIDTTNPSDIKVVINDSADPNGAAKVYDAEQFVDAWDDIGETYVATNQTNLANVEHELTFSHADIDGVNSEKLTDAELSDFDKEQFSINK